MIFRWLDNLFKKKPAMPPLPQKRYYQQTIKQTPNVSAGRKIKPTHIIVHHSSGAYAGSVAWCCNPASKVSYHCIIARDGKRTILADATQRTWHAGVSSLNGKKDANSWSVGVSWEGDTHITPISEDAILSAVEYLIPIMDEFDIPVKNVLRHADIAPGRKDDCSPQAHAILTKTLNQIK